MRPRVATCNGRYGFLTLMWMAGIYWLSSRSDLGPSGNDPVVQIASNLAHLPLFAGLAFCWFKTLAAMPHASWRRYGVAFLASATWAGLDEWHQSFVPGREASVVDSVLDLAGIIGMLLILRLWAVHESRAARTMSLESPGSSARVASWKV